MLNRPEIQPDVSGPRGHAWKFRPPAILNMNADETGNLAQWLVFNPFTHAVWDGWVISLAHLRPIVGQAVDPPKRHPDAEYELNVIALNPKEPAPDIMCRPDGARMYFLEPIDVSEQFWGVTDEEAKDITEELIAKMLQGEFDPDEDHRERWRDHISKMVGDRRALRGSTRINLGVN